MDVVEAAVIRAAVTRGYLTEAQVREALLLREDLRNQGREAPILQILGARFLAPEHQVDLRAVYASAVEAAQEEESSLAFEVPPTPAEQEMLLSSEDELAVPMFLMERGDDAQARLAQPPEEDPEPVRQMLAMSGDPDRDAGETDEPPPSPETTGSGLWRWIKGRMTSE